jgi:hypothetical protein
MSSAHSSTTPTPPTINWITPWFPVNGPALQEALCSPTAYANYLQELTYLGQAIGNLDSEGWATVTSTDTSIVMTQTDQVGTFTLSGAPNSAGLPEAALRQGVKPMDDSDNYLYELNFVGTNSGVGHNTYLFVAGSSALSGALAAIAQALVKFAPAWLNSVASSIENSFGALADGALLPAEEGAQDAATTAGVAFAEGVAAAAGAVAAVLAVAALLLDLLEKDFQVHISVINQSSKNFMILPNYYLQDGASSLIEAANSCANFTTDPAYSFLLNNVPPTICSSSPYLFPFSACAQSYNGSSIVQASQYDLVYQHDGYSAPGVMLQFLECDYDPPTTQGGYGTLTPSQSSGGWIGMVVNPHYKTSDGANIAMFVAGANLDNAEDWFDQYDDTTPASTGSQASLTTTLTWTLALGNPVKNPETDVWSWNIVVTIVDTV